jgi:hypothetical protein
MHTSPGGAMMAAALSEDGFEAIFPVPDVPVISTRLTGRAMPP